MAAAPEHADGGSTAQVQRALYDAFHLQIRYDHRGRGAEIRVTVAAPLLGEITGIAERAAAPAPGVDQPFGVRPRQDSNLRPSAWKASGVERCAHLRLRWSLANENRQSACCHFRGIHGRTPPVLPRPT
ncbi:hypothetical protein [Streptomyces spirodelae]|uniref:Uncharacterized protein n=1 Tax=Streptomyces spirodelae TaxID=2812904 RepID=A0ABS3WQ47_9ACTN|nr:hypothetical protein [Streptomyces spirodelae]MBO8184987.1 hypothetical protein [Streptomyces spirodelae]